MNVNNEKRGSANQTGNPFFRKESFFPFILIFCVSLLLYQCAQMAVPTGGERDVEPPKVLKFTPENESINFKSKTIAIEFDEYVVVQGLGNQLIVTPPLKHEIDFHLKKRTLYLEIQDTLLDETTYIFSFGEGVKDLTEGNTNPNLKYVFSTGDYLDSMRVQGTVIDAYTLKPVEGATVMLYTDMGDSVPMNEKPKYFTQTKATGRFNLEYLKEDDYKLFVLKDENQNYLYDMPTEQIGFLDSTIRPFALDTLMEEVDIRLFLEDNIEQAIKKVSFRQPGKMTITFSKPLEQEIELKPLAPKFRIDWAKHEKLTVGDTVVYWVQPHSLNDSLTYEVRLNDEVLDTIDPYLAGNPKKIPDLKLQTRVQSNLDFFKPFTFESDFPVASIDTMRIFMYRDSTQVYNFEIKQTDEVGRKFMIDYDWEFDKNYKLTIDDSVFVSIYGQKNDSTNFSFGIHDKDHYGLIEVQLEMPDSIDHDMVLQLIDNQDKVVKEKTLRSSETVTFERLQPMEYRFRMIYDENNNGKWDTGNYMEGRQPERVVYFPEKMNVRSNWDLEYEWNLQEVEEEEVEEDVDEEVIEEEEGGED